MSAQTWATTEDMAARLRISPRTVRRRVREGTWPASRVGNLIRFSPDQQEQIAQSLAPQVTPIRSASRIRDAFKSRRAA